MYRRITLGLGALFAIGALGLVFTRAESQPQAKALVVLQPTTPGVAQNGHVTVTGTGVFGALKMAFGAGAGKVLTSDAFGNGTWQNPPGLQLPFDGTTLVISPTAAFKVTNQHSGYAIFGISEFPNTASVAGRADYNNSSGIYGLSTAAGYGVYGRSEGVGGRGVFGHAAGGTYGVYGLGEGNGTRGLAGFATATSGQNFGVWAEAAGHQGMGVYGAATHTTGTVYAVYGISSSPINGYGLYASGRSGASGTKSFRIDHPHDPANRYLLHYSSESPEPMNFYSGVVTTDGAGGAWIDLPDYFGEINREFRYTLTVVDDSDSEEFVLVKVAREIRDNRFKIRSSAPRTKVSWRVEAVRNDAWVRAYGAPTEVEKQGTERGRYQHPELYGAPAEQSMDPRQLGRP